MDEFDDMKPNQFKGNSSSTEQSAEYLPVLKLGNGKSPWVNEYLKGDCSAACRQGTYTALDIALPNVFLVRKAEHSLL